jgi:peptidyl-dipeptidase A
MRASIRRIGLLVACLSAGAAAALAAGPGDAAKPGKTAKPTTKQAKKTPVQKDADAFLATVQGLVWPVSTTASLADWAAATDVTPEHVAQRTGADKALAAVIGSTTVIDKTKALLKDEKQLDELTVRQLQKLLLAAAENPGTIPEVVAKRVELESKQSAILDGYTFCLQPKAASCAKPVTANDIDDILKKSRDLNERQRIWSVSKEIGRPLKPGLIELVKLRNQVAKEMGYHSYFALKVADYGMTVDEMMKLLDDTLVTTKPIYDGLLCWAKNQLAARFKRPPPKLIPAHWIGNRWAQSWPGLVEAASLDPLFKGSSPENIVKSAESFYVSLGFEKLPPSFWERSDLYPVPPGLARKKNSHASAWHIDHAQDVRSLMSVQANEQWFATSHHELGHIYYFLSYSRPEVPFLLREGANRAFHEAIGELAKLASQQTPYLMKIGVLPEGKAPDPAGWLLQSALDSIVFLPWSAGTMSHFERDLYETELPPSDWQGKWWDYVAQFQGVTPPGGRDPELCDACTKTHINDDAAEYYDYALATLIKFQLHDHICTKVLKQDVRACDYSGNKEVGAFLKSILSQGATRDWRKVIKDATGEAISPRALMAFYAPLTADLAKRNEGKDCSR